MWWFVLIAGFVLASIPSMLYQTFNGLSLFGLTLCLLAAGFILLREVDR